jgi:hypothetical protein
VHEVGNPVQGASRARVAQPIVDTWRTQHTIAISVQLLGLPQQAFVFSPRGADWLLAPQS